MGSELTERAVRIPPQERLNVFALVIYIPGPLGIFLDDLRRKLVPGCNPHAHVSLLPPRPLAVDWTVAADRVGAVLNGWERFEIELTGLGVFPVTDVVYIEIGRGSGELRRVHQAMNAGPLEFQEPFVYHPHITLAQGLPHEQVADACETAQRLWHEYSGPRHFQADHAAFVQ